MGLIWPILARVLHKSQHPDDTRTRLSFLTESRGDDSSSRIIYHRYHNQGLFAYYVDVSTPAKIFVRFGYLRPCYFDTYGVRKFRKQCYKTLRKSLALKSNFLT